MNPRIVFHWQCGVFICNDANGNLIAIYYDDAYYYYLRNGQGDIVGLLDSTKTLVVSYTYDAWGKLLSMTGTLATTLGVDNPFRYRGYYYDTETGLYYLQSRYYDPEVGRFLNCDVYASTGQGILGCNMYTYCGNNSVNMSDSSGAAPYSTKVGDGGSSGKSIKTELIRPKREPKNKWIRARNMIKDADVADDVRDFLYTALDTAVMYKNETYHFDNWNCSQFVNEILWACGVPVAEYKQYGSGIRGGTAHQREYAYGRGLGNVTGLGWAHSSDMSLLQPGDLLYWNTNPGHVAIYIGEGWIIDNASSFNSGVRLLPPDSPLDEWVRPQF